MDKKDLIKPLERLAPRDTEKDRKNFIRQRIGHAYMFADPTHAPVSMHRPQLIEERFVNVDHSTKYRDNTVRQCRISTTHMEIFREFLNQ